MKGQWLAIFLKISLVVTLSFCLKTGDPGKDTRVNAKIDFGALDLSVKYNKTSSNDTDSYDIDISFNQDSGASENVTVASNKSVSFRARKYARKFSNGIVKPQVNYEKCKQSSKDYFKSIKRVLKSNRYSSQSYQLSVPFADFENHLFRTTTQNKSCDEYFVNFKKQFFLQFSNHSVEEYRQNLFCNRMKMIKEHNRAFKKGEKSYQLTMYGFAALSKDEFIVSRTGFYVKASPPSPQVKVNEKITTKSTTTKTTKAKSTTKVPTTTESFRQKTQTNPVDWSTSGFLPAVKDQGYCGSCYAFSAIGAVEFLYRQKTKSNAVFSEQQTVDCLPDNFRCSGGMQHLVYDYLKTCKCGLANESSYPYSSSRDTSDKTCQRSFRAEGFTITGYYANWSGGFEGWGTTTIDELKALVAQRVIAIAIYAGSKLQGYKSGIFSSDECLGSSPNHAVLLVGYGTAPDGQEYWKIRNSWGPNWGENGYFRMNMNGNDCGVRYYVVYPTIG